MKRKVYKYIHKCKKNPKAEIVSFIHDSKERMLFFHANIYVTIKNERFTIDH
jgi:hypothetical protein